MPKRKRSAQDDLEEKLAKHRQELFKVLKAAKGLERQRMAKRINDPKSTAEKKARINREIIVLKSIELQSVAHAHLCSSLLKIKGVADFTNLPDEIKNGVPRPEISEEERAALHNVTSALYNQDKVRQTLEKAVKDICQTLQVPIPEKGKRKRERSDKKGTAVTDEKDEHPADKPAPANGAVSKAAAQETETLRLLKEQAAAGEGEEWRGILDPEEEERVISRLDEMLGSSSESDGKEDDKNVAELDPMEISDISGSEASDEEVLLADSESEGSKSDEGADESEEDSDDESHVSPPPKAARKEAKRDTTGRPTNSMFLPSLMGGYVSGSDSEASDVDVAPAVRKNRRGQKARQKIWEEKFGSRAKHLTKELTAKDSVWDPKRGAVDGSDKRPWKKGIRNVFRKSGDQEDNPNSMEIGEKKKPPPKKDNDGVLHPSWEARKKAKEAQQTATFTGKKVVFD